MTKIKSLPDKIGMVLSIGCVIHCIVLPFVIPLLPFLGFMFDHGSNFHLILAGIIALIASIAFVPGYLKHKSFAPSIVALIGIATIIGTGLIEKFDEHHANHPSLLIITMAVGSVFIVIGHWGNHILSCRCKHHFKE